MEPSSWHGFMQITKVDAAKREVAGILSAELLDKSGEILDYERSKPYFKAWSNEISKATGSGSDPLRHSLGNVREMHNEKSPAVGKLVHFEADDASKSFLGVAKILDDNAWMKCANGVYTGFSIGGKYVGGKPVGGGRYVAEPSEVSIVDNPALGAAHFSYVKADGTTELRKFHQESFENRLAKLISDELHKDHETFQVRNGNPNFTPSDNISPDDPDGDGKPDRLLFDITGQQDADQQGGPQAPRTEWSDDEKWVQSLTSGTYEKSDWCECNECRKEMGFIAELARRFGEDAARVTVEKSDSRNKTGHLVTESDGTKHLPTGYGGKPSHRLMGAAWAALHGGYRGKKYSGPDKQKAIDKLKRLYAREGLKTPAQKSLLTEVEKNHSFTGNHHAEEIAMTQEDVQKMIDQSVEKRLELEKGKRKERAENVVKAAEGFGKAHDAYSGEVKKFTDSIRKMAGAELGEDFQMESTDPGTAIRQVDNKTEGQLEKPTSTISPAPQKSMTADEVQKAVNDGIAGALKQIFTAPTEARKSAPGVGDRSSSVPGGTTISDELKKRIEASAPVAGLNSDLVKRAVIDDEPAAILQLMKSAPPVEHELPMVVQQHWARVGRRTH